MDDDNIAHPTRDSFGAMIRKFIKVDTLRIDLNMVDYLRIDIVFDVTKPLHRCFAIGSTCPPKLCPLQYERLPTLCHGCGIIGHSLEFCSTFKPMSTSKLQYKDWIRYIPPRMQEVATTIVLLGNTMTPLAFASNMGHPPVTHGVETNTDAPLLFDNMGLSDIPTTILPTQPVGELDNEMGKSFLTMSSMLLVFDEWLSKSSSPPAATNDKEVPALISRGAKRRSSMQDDNKLKKPRPPP
ncbi:hypothetical protein V6N11_034414 [Hibiscus sabdariffa]|uniref:Zinc knuckle CX2CX4HX4C domain-containing protein n=2 Tax=Hibiscus sabdariffa TaxID=183260 RepID=A0ABR2B266_9ROSI